VEEVIDSNMEEDSVTIGKNVARSPVVLPIAVPIDRNTLPTSTLAVDAHYSFPGVGFHGLHSFQDI
jgi:hypothetical protein